ncbi:response regulator transcription factor [Haloactinopolyspora sp.]|uniref:response regulator transcription factor n=1 Tax=Haloactinopolyspora sp. TaxID=1966353 RepID=UPI002638E3DD|nr:response regulator transcription factor [Haloactinopolyspora sp.]
MTITDTSQRQLRVVLVDDDPLVRTGLEGILSTAGDITVAGQAGDGHAAVDAVLRHAPDVVLMDIRMPRMDGLAATAALTRLPRAPKVVVLTTFDLDEYVFRALEAGAGGFLLKDASPQEIIAAVRAVAAGDAMLAPRVTTRLIAHFVGLHTDPRRADAQARLALLTPREREIVSAVAAGRSNSDIAGDMYLSEATVKTHLTRIFAKLDASNRVQVAMLAYDAGLTMS